MQDEIKDEWVEAGVAAAMKPRVHVGNRECDKAQEVSIILAAVAPLIRAEAEDRHRHLLGNIARQAQAIAATELAAKNLLAAVAQARAQIEVLRKALELAEDALSRSPFSTQMWPNGTHPQTGIQAIRAALKEPSHDH